MILTNPQERTRFLRFLAVGAFGFVVDFSVFNLVIQVAHIPAVIAQGISFICAIISNFLWNRYWTYPDSRTKPIGAQMAQFTLISGIGLLIRFALFSILEQNLVNAAAKLLPQGYGSLANVVGHNSTLAFSVLVVLLWNFFANRFWTYNDVKS
jgi:putative flippase GtrA